MPAAPIQDEPGRCQGALAMVTDISERKRAGGDRRVPWTQAAEPVGNGGRPGAVQRALATSWQASM